MLKNGVIPFFVFALSGCGVPDFPKYARLGDLRVLTIKALSDQSEVNPGTTVTLQPVISDVSGGGRTLNVTVETCIDPGITFGAQPRCNNPDTTTSSSFSSTTLGANNTFTGEAPTFTVSVPNLPLTLPTTKHNGLTYLVTYNITAPDGVTVIAFKRIIVSDPSKTVKNKNPVLAAVTANGTALAASNTYNAAAQDLTPSFTLAAEGYQHMGPDGALTSQTESLTTTWFYTDGTIKYQRTDTTSENHWEPAREPGRGVALVLVTHDGRGGQDYKVFQFN